jgi:putative membrane protein
MLRWVIALLLNALVIFMVARMTPGVRIKSYGTAIGVAIVYGILAVVLGPILKLITFPLTLLTFGLFLLVINGFLLWLTDKLLHGLEIKGFGPLAVMTVGTSIGSVLVSWIVGR